VRQRSSHLGPGNGALSGEPVSCGVALSAGTTRKEFCVSACSGDSKKEWEWLSPARANFLWKEIVTISDCGLHRVSVAHFSSFLFKSNYS
jgi:hypothetical protein